MSVNNWVYNNQQQQQQATTSQALIQAQQTCVSGGSIMPLIGAATLGGVSSGNTAGPFIGSVYGMSGLQQYPALNIVTEQEMKFVEELRKNKLYRLAAR